MSGISFRYRKTERAIDAGFHLFDGGEIATTSDWHVGDEVRVCFEVNDAIANQITWNAPSTMHDVPHSRFVHIPCVVVSRSHSVVWKAVGQLHRLSDCSVVLQAKSGEWEDVLLWIVKGIKPEWVTEES